LDLALAASLLAGSLGVGGAASPLLAQQPEPSPAAAPAEQEADSSRIRIMERLRRLARPPGFDSVLYMEDSVRLAEAAAGIRPTSAQADSVTRALLSMPGYSLTEYEGGSADFQAQERNLVLTAAEGARARLLREGMAFEA